ncbi:hypothetical protein HPB47_004484 [Ixodes persulcatus]|uniref:Uncharacterized protein n=1 Tax=Ixodes persulcatus TaxID=34615 RepID=A0AC60PFM8_IXOPE|nr:hypothetical protein HPB47_004484 [Ixodes persulcatus]
MYVAAERLSLQELSKTRGPVAVAVHPGALGSPRRLAETCVPVGGCSRRSEDFECMPRIVPVTTGDPLEVDLGLLHQAGLGLLSEGAGDTVGLPPVGDDAAVASSSAASSTGACQVPGHGSPQALESNPRQTTWASSLRRRPAAATLPPPASPSSGDSSSSGSWSPDSTEGHPSARESLGQAAASPLWGGRLGQGRPGGGRATLHSRPRQSGALPQTTRSGGSALSQEARLQEGEDREGVPRTPSREALLRALREAVEEEPPEKFQGQRLWAVAREAISGADYLRPINDYIRDVFFLDQRRSQPQSSRQTLPRESRRRRSRREYAKTQEMFNRRPADCARAVLDGPVEAGWRTEKKLKVETDVTFCVRDQPLPVATTATIWRYLGVQFFTEGRRRGRVDRDLRELLERVTRAPLKPQQRLFILRGFLLPRLHHRLVLGLWGVGALSKLDRMTRAAIRKWRALPHDTPMGYFHAPVSEGGLGVTSLRTAIPGMTLARIKGLRFSDHPGCEAALQCRMLTDQVRRARQAANLDGVSLTTKADVHKYWADKLHVSYDGRHYVNVIKLRVNALPTLSRTKRGRPDGVSCRAGCRARESLGHVLQACHRGHRGRVKRHDNIARYIAMRLHQLQWTVLWEPHYTVQDE